MSARHLHIDAFKWVASNLIVLHHFNCYGPLADALSLWQRDIAQWFYDDARMAVQVFLVIGGYLAANALVPQSQAQFSSPWRLIGKRYLRLVPPFMSALILVALCSLLARPWLASDIHPIYTGWVQILAHLSLTHSLVGVEPMSVGIWYVAIDFQLFALTVLLLWLGRSQVKWLILAMTLSSLFYFNLHEEGDNWAPYFFGAYGMGIIAGWCVQGRVSRQWAYALLLLGVLALVIDFRGRIAIAWGTALVLWQFPIKGTTHHSQGLNTNKSHCFTFFVHRFGQASYALFLTHFAVLILGNALWIHLNWSFEQAPAVFSVLLWLACQGTALAFELWVERPLGKFWR